MILLCVYVRTFKLFPREFSLRRISTVALEILRISGNQFGNFSFFSELFLRWLQALLKRFDVVLCSLASLEKYDVLILGFINDILKDGVELLYVFVSLQYLYYNFIQRWQT